MNVNEILEKVSKNNPKWLRIAQSFGASPTESKDIVQDMYLIVHKQIQRGVNIIHEPSGEPNYFYIYKVIKSIFYNLKRIESNVDFINIDDIVNLPDTPIHPLADYSYDVDSHLKDFNWFPRKIFNLVRGGESLSEISKRTKIRYVDLYYRIKKVKDYLKSQIK